jgi:glycine betaine/proline transport system permease protein
MLPKLPLASWVDTIVEWLEDNTEWLFDPLKDSMELFVEKLGEGLMLFPAWFFIIGLTVVAYFLSKRNIGLPLFTFAGLFLINNLGYWESMMTTLSLILTSSLISVIIGVPLGIWMSKSKTMQSIITPVLDFMQTMPAFVYLIPAVSFFGIGMVPGVIASVIFAMPPTVRLTNLGIRQVSTELIEAADAFGSTGSQKLFKVQLPMAKSTIMAGVNQTIMLALSMVVIASMIGAKGVGVDVYRAITRNEPGLGFESGLVIVILAIILDRVSQSLTAQKGAN